MRAGEHTVAVRFEDQHLYEHDGGHDVHLIPLSADTTIDEVNEWMSWMVPGQPASDGTESGTFLGGAHDIITPELLERAGSTGENRGGAAKTSYFDVTPNPGAHAVVSEVPDPVEKGLLETFSIPFDE